MRALVAILCCVTLAGCGGEAPAPRAGGPSVILVTIDTLRADHTTPVEPALLTTPRLEELGGGGAVFTRCLAAQPETGPSIASTMTSRYPREIGVRENGDVLPREIPTLAESFSAAGYATGAFVSTYLLKPHACGLDRGFDTYDHEMTRANLGHERFERSAGETAALAAAWLRRQAGRPVFLWVHFYDPHGLYDPGEEIAAKFRRSTGRPPLDPRQIVKYQRFHVPPGSDEFSLDPDDYVARYDGEIFLADRGLGVVLAAAPAGAIVAVHADHGEGLGEHGYWFRHGSRLDRAALNVPLVFAGPGVPEGARRPGVVENLDIAPTLLDLAGLAPLPDARGRSLFDGASPRPEEPISFAEARRFGGVIDQTGIDTRYKVSATVRSHRMVLWPETGESVLYDLEADPGESVDVSAEAPDVADRLGTAIRRWLLIGDRRSGETTLPDIDKALRGLGYVEGR